MSYQNVDWSRGPRPLAIAIRGLDLLNVVVKYIAGALLGIATAAVAIQILVRFALSAWGWNVSAPWTEEVARYCSIWAVFLGVAVISRHSGLIAVDMFPQLLPKRPGNLLKIGATLFTLAFFILVAMIGIQFTHEGLYDTSPVLRLRMVWVHAAIPVGSILAAINLLAFTLECLFFGRDAVVEEDLELRLD